MKLCRLRANLHDRKRRRPCCCLNIGTRISTRASIQDALTYFQQAYDIRDSPKTEDGS